MDRSGGISWAELSLFASALRERLVWSKLGRTGELDHALARARPALEALARLGGDPRFALAVLVGARWRRLRSPGANVRTWIRALEHLADSAELERLLQGAQSPRGQFMAASADALEFLRKFVWQDEGVFETKPSRWRAETARWRSQGADAALAVLAWHIRAGTKARRTDLVLLARLIEAFDLVRSRSGETPPVEAIKQRLKRIKGKDYYEKFVIPNRRSEFHTNHCFVAWQSGEAILQRCGTACFPNAPMEDWWERDLIRVRHDRPRNAGEKPLPPIREG